MLNQKTDNLIQGMLDDISDLHFEKAEENQRRMEVLGILIQIKCDIQHDAYKKEDIISALELAIIRLGWEHE